MKEEEGKREEEKGRQEGKRWRRRKMYERKKGRRRKTDSELQLAFSKRNKKRSHQ